MFTKAFSTPYYAVIFVSQKSENLDGYAEYDELTLKLAHEQTGFLGYENASGIFISYWESMEAIGIWSRHPVHIKAKENAHQWYTYYHSQICKVEQARVFNSENMTT